MRDRFTWLMLAAACASGVSLIPTLAMAHSASDAYLTLTTESDQQRTRGQEIVVHGQWDVAIRDLDFVMRIDANGDGDITWGELKGKLGEIDRYVYSRISVRNGRAACQIEPREHRVVEHADGTYVALFFDARCQSKADATTLDYRLFFPIDPSHRAIVIWKVRDATATAVLSPEHATITVRNGS